MLDKRTALHLAQRVGLGAAPGQIERILDQGWDGFLAEQLHPSIMTLPESVTAQLQGLSCFGNPVDLYASYWWQTQVEDPKAVADAERKRLDTREIGVLRDARTARLALAIGSPWQLYEALVEFWFNHFNVFWGKGEARIWLGAYESQAIRPHALGRFSDLLLATAKHPAMLVYLDNAQNLYLQPRLVGESATTASKARPPRASINENYAREVMELHTLGVDGGYAQRDVTALAHILSGWTVSAGADTLAAARHLKRLRGVSRFERRRHDPSAQFFLGRDFRGDTEDEADAALLLLAKHPSTARHVSYKLAQFFVADSPPLDLVQTMSKVFLSTNGDVRAVVAAMFGDPIFRSPTNFGTKFKTPYRFVISTTRAVGARTPNHDKLNGALTQLAQPLYGCVSPDGYACTESAWLDPQAILDRLSFARRAAAGVFTSDNETFSRIPADPKSLINLLGPAFTEKTKMLIDRTPPARRALAILGSPDFMRC